jgi:CHAT domain-containing protein
MTCADSNNASKLRHFPLRHPGHLGLFREGAADVAAVRSLASLLETADELCEVGHQLGAEDKNVLLGQAAAEATIKAISADGRLGCARVVHLATHGLIAGDLKGVAEPARLQTLGNGFAKEPCSV